MITWRDSLNLIFPFFLFISFTGLKKTLCKAKDLWGADLTPWTVSMKEGSPISHVTCCTIRMQIGSCNINCLNHMCKSCKCGGPGKHEAPIYLYICIYFIYSIYTYYVNMCWLTCEDAHVSELGRSHEPSCEIPRISTSHGVVETPRSRTPCCPSSFWPTS